MRRIWAYALEALGALWVNRGRTLLTMLGMIIGTSSVIAVMGISAAASGGIAATLSSSGDPGIQLSPDPQQDNPSAAGLQFRDVAQLSAALGDSVERVTPIYTRFYRARANGISYQTLIVSNRTLHDVRTMLDGRRITEGDINSGAHIAVLGRKALRDRFFGNRSAVGETIRISGMRFRIVGVYDELKAGLFNSTSGDYIEIPYTTYHALEPGQIDGIRLYPTNRADTESITANAKRTLQHLHGERTRYDSTDFLSVFNTFDKALSAIGAGLSAIGAVALVVAGIGIMNIMLVSVSERTREIGIRKAVGANRRDIALQFLMESIIIALGGGGIGIALGLITTIVAASIISRQLGATIIPYLLLVSVALAFSITIGMAFGAYPAVRAARLDPIEALRS